jgi:hypothetical protein
MTQQSTSTIRPQQGEVRQLVPSEILRPVHFPTNYLQKHAVMGHLGQMNQRLGIAPGKGWTVAGELVKRFWHFSFRPVKFYQEMPEQCCAREPATPPRGFPDLWLRAFHLTRQTSGEGFNL